MSRAAARPLGEALVLLGGGVAITAASLHAPSPWRALLVLPLALLVPGYGWLAAAFGTRERPDLLPALALCLLLGMASFALLPLLLAALSLRITRDNLLATADGAIALLALVVLVRAALDARRAPAGAGERARLAGAGHVFALCLAVGAAIGVLAVAPHLLPSTPPVPYSQIYLNGGWAQLHNTVHMAPGRPLVVGFTVANGSDRAARYRVMARIDGQPAWQPTTLVVPAHARRPGQVIGLVPPKGCGHRLTLILAEPGGRQLAPLTLYVHGGRGGCA